MDTQELPGTFTYVGLVTLHKTLPRRDEQVHLWLWEHQQDGKEYEQGFFGDDKDETYQTLARLVRNICANERLMPLPGHIENVGTKDGKCVMLGYTDLGGKYFGCLIYADPGETEKAKLKLTNYLNRIREENEGDYEYKPLTEKQRVAILEDGIYVES